VLNLLVSVELLTKDAQGKYALAPESAAFLVSTKPSFQGGIFRQVSQHLIPSWLNLTENVKTGKPEIAVNEHKRGAEFFEQLVEDIFPLSYGPAQTLADALHVAQLSKPYKVLDIASGSGVWGIALAQKSKQVQVTAVDWPSVLNVTRRVTQKYNVADRFSYVEGDMQEVNYGKNYDLATLGQILHSEGAERSKRLLQRVFDALAPGGTIAIAEFVANDTRTGPPQAMIFAVHMMLNTDQGDTFTFKEIASWLKEIGYENPRQLEAPGPSPLILANKPK
jgi:ubiquinone/menaquinone biosynthesis C-methylase UbiE